MPTPVAVAPGPLRRTQNRATSSSRRLAMVVATGVLAGMLVACGSSGGSTAGSKAATTTTTTPGPPGAAGTVAALSASSMEVQNPQSGQVTVNWTSSTAFTRAQTANAAAVAVGDCATVSGPPSSSSTAPIAARTFTLMQADPSGNCTDTARGGGFGGGGGGGSGGGSGGRGRGGTEANGSTVPRNRGTGRGGAGFAFATGKVTAVSGTGFTIEGIRREGAQGQGPTTTTPTPQTITVTTDSSTTYTQLAAASAAALAVGQCVTARGPADDTGAITATAINIRPPGPNGCANGFGNGRPGDSTPPTSG